MAQFGEWIEGYSVPVMNEREVRAAAGLLLVPGLMAFTQAFQTGNFTATRLMILTFMVDFAIRVLVNPRYAPTLVLGRFFVRNQQPEYSGAPQKRFAWALGLGISLFMMIWTTGLNLSGPVALLGCVTCIVLLFLESAFGICVGCMIYNRIWPGSAQLCPGGVCEVQTRAPITYIRRGEAAVLGVAFAGLIAAVPVVSSLAPPSMPGRHAATDASCEVPAFAKAIGHEEMWKLHNGCS